MTALELLESILPLNRTVSRLDREYDRVYSAITACVGPYDQPMIQGVGSGDKRYDTLAEISTERDRVWDELIKRKEICFRIFDCMGDPSWAYLLERFYLDDDNKTVEEIGKEIPVSRVTVYRIKRKAIKEFTEIFNKSADSDLLALKVDTR